MKDLDKLLYSGNILDRVTKLEAQFNTLKSGTLKVTVLDHITEDMGLQVAGEFRSGNSLEPGYGFSGMRMGYPGFAYAGGVWALAGVNNDTLEFGIDYATGKAYAGGGAVTIGSDGIKEYNGVLLTGWWQTDGDLFLGNNLATPAGTRFSFFTNAQVYNGEAMPAGTFMLGDNSVGKANLKLDPTTGQLQFRGETTVQAYVGTDGVIYAGGGNAYINTTGFHTIYNATGFTFDSPGGTADISLMHQAGDILSIDYSGSGGVLRINNPTHPSGQKLTGGTAAAGRLWIVASSGDCGGIYLQGNDSGEIDNYIGTKNPVAHSAVWKVRSTPDAKDIFYVLTEPVAAEWANGGIKLMNGAAIINEFSIDGTMAGNSDTALPTEKAVVTYVAAHGGVAAAGTSQYQMLTTGATPFTAVWSDFWIRGTTGGTTKLSVTNAKTLELIAADNYALTVAANTSISGTNTGDSASVPVAQVTGGGVLATGGFTLTVPANMTLAGMAAIADAPSDGTTYGRKNAAWSATAAGLADAPSDGTLYGRKNAAWTAVPAGGGGATPLQVQMFS